MAGGTGGHIFPALAIAQELTSQGVEVHWLGTQDRMEADLVPKYGYPIHFIKVSGIVGKGLGSLIKAPFQVFSATLEARKIIKEFNPDVVIGMGGYVCGPGGLAAKSCGIPLFIHEQNSVVGLTNKLLSKISRKVLSAFPISLPNAVQVGQPLRAEFNQLIPTQNLQRYYQLAKDEYARLLEFCGVYDQRNLSDSLVEKLLNSSNSLSHLDLPKTKEQLVALFTDVERVFAEEEFPHQAYQLLYNSLTPEQKLDFNQLSLSSETLNLQIIGGSLGAKVLNDRFPHIYAALTAEGYNLQINHQAGKGKVEELKQLLENLEIDPTKYQVREFIEDMKAAYLDSDIILCRSGAMTVFEIAATNR